MKEEDKMKKEYTEPEVEIICLAMADVITESEGQGGGDID